MCSFINRVKLAVKKRLGRRRDGRVLLGEVAATSTGRPVGVHGGGALVLDSKGPGSALREIVGCAVRAVHLGGAVVFLDSSRERAVRSTLARAVDVAGRGSMVRALDPFVYRVPWGRLSDRAILAIALCQGRCEDPYYRRTCERHILESICVLKSMDIEPNLRQLVEVSHPVELLEFAQQQGEQECVAYLRSLSSAQLQLIYGWRSYASSVLASSVGRAFDAPTPDGGHLDLLRAIMEKKVVYFRLEERCFSHLTQLMYEAILQDLLSAASELVGSVTPSLVAITEFSRIDTSALADLLDRGRSANVSVVTGIQRLG
jgi:hypothetical protein